MTSWTPILNTGATWAPADLNAFQDNAFQDDTFQTAEVVWAPVVSADGSWFNLAIVCMAFIGAMVT